MLADLLRIRRHVVERKGFGFPAEIVSRHFTANAARIRAGVMQATCDDADTTYTVRHLARPVRGLADPHADTRHRAPGRPA